MSVILPLSSQERANIKQWWDYYVVEIFFLLYQQDKLCDPPKFLRMGNASIICRVRCVRPSWHGFGND